MASMATGTADATDTLPSSGPASAPRPSGRVPLGIGAGLAATLLVVLALRLFSGRPLGVEDNGDGYRLFCGAGLTPLTMDGYASWRGGWTTDFAVGPPTCPDQVPSSALVI